jgi:predicted nucleic acid-binding protein
MKRYVLDANALITFIVNRAGADEVEELLKGTARTVPLLLSVVNWGEVYYCFWRAGGRQAAEQKMAEVAQVPIEVVDVDQSTAKLAASLKAERSLPYADCFAAALAIQQDAGLVTADKDFRVVADQLTIVWIGPSSGRAPN